MIQTRSYIFSERDSTRLVMTTLKVTSTPFLNSLHSIIITLILMIIFHCGPCLFASTESLRQRNSSIFTHSNLGNDLQLSSKSFSSRINYVIHEAQEARLQFAQMAEENSLHSSSSMVFNECVDLLDDSIDHLYSINRSSQNKAQAAMENSSPSCSQNTDTCSSMSAILANQQLCMERLDHYVMYMINNKYNDMGKYPALRAAINNLDLLLSRIVSTFLAKTSESSAQRPNSFKYVIPQDEASWSGGQLDNSDDKLMANTSEQIAANNMVTVALDGSGDYKSIVEAINMAPDNSNQKFFIYVKRGVYREYIEIPKSKRNIVMVGQGMDITVITGSRSRASDTARTFRTATFAVKGCGFMAQNITFENTAGSSGNQAVAVLSKANNLVFYRCAFKGYQDTLYARSGLQFFRECKIYGTVDFIFGDATAVFQKCQIIARKRSLPNQYNTVTAQQRQLECSATGYSFHMCTFTAEDGLSTSPTRTFLGRPWKQAYSRVVVMKSNLGSLIDKLGWVPWDETSKGLDTLYYGEYMNYGAGSDVNGRVKWPGYHPHMTLNEANKFTVRNFIFGDKWLPSTGVPYDLDL